MDRQVIFRILNLLFLVICFGSCDNLKVNCDECSEKPEYIDLRINFNTNFKYPQVIFYLYEGNIDNGKLIFSDTTNRNQYNINVKRSKMFSIKAKYIGINGDTLNVINGTKIKLKNYSEFCENEECWVVSNNIINARF